MKAFAEAWAALLGWFDLATARDGAAARFNFSRAGLINAVGCYLAVAALGLVIAALLGQSPGWTGALVYLGLQLPPLLAVWLVIGLNGLLLRPANGALPLLVVATYAMALIALLRLPFAAYGPAGVSNLLLGVLAFLLYRAGRVIGGWWIGGAVAFALLCTAALVTETIGLYMLLTGGEGIG